GARERRGDGDDRHGVGIGLRQRRHEVGETWAGNDVAGGGAARGAGVAVGHESGTLLVTRPDEAQASRSEAAKELDVVNAGDAKEVMEPMGGTERFERFPGAHGASSIGMRSGA